MARVSFAVAAVAIAAVVAFAGGDSNTIDGPRVARDLLVIAKRGDLDTYRADYTTTRRRGTSLTLRAEVRVWVRAQPALDAELAGGQLTVSTASGAWICTQVSGKPTCLQQSATSALLSGATPYAVALASGRYTVTRDADRRIAGETARCFSVRLRSTAIELQGLGTRLDACFAADGVPLWTRLEHDGVDDVREARQVTRAVPPADLAAVARAYTDGSVPALARR